MDAPAPGPEHDGAFSAIRASSDPVAAEELTRRPQPDGAHPERTPSAGNGRLFTKLQPDGPLPLGVAPDAQRYSLAVIEGARAGTKEVKRMVPDPHGEYVEASPELIAKYYAQTLFSVPARVFFGAIAAAIVAMLSWSPVRELMDAAPVLYLPVLACVAVLTYRVITGRNPFFANDTSPSFLRLADPSVPLADDDLVPRPAEGFLDRPSLRVGPGGGDDAPSSGS
jgi:hypothetical protein